MAHAEPSGPYLAAVRRAFDVARQASAGPRGARPVHLLVGIADGEGPAAAALRPADGRPLRAIVTDVAGVAADGPAGYLQMQAQHGAMSLAAERGEAPGVEHLLVALLDQGTPEVLDALSGAGLDPTAIRAAALAALGAPPDLPPVALETTPAGTLDRPALPVTDLNPRAWSVLCWRQEHLPIGMLRRRSDTRALRHLERAAVLRVADRLALDDDQRYSLLQHHDEAVGERVARARPELGGPHRGRGARPRVPRRRRRWLRVTTGWGVWVGNRRMAVQSRWFRLRVARAYRGAPQP